jgi:phosphoenolpyruvate carboxykinase (GTP)
VLAWIFRRLDGEADARQTPIGWVPRAEDLDLSDLEITPEHLDELLGVDEEGLKSELEQVSEFLDKFGDRLPAEMRAQHEALQAKLA